MALNSLVSQVMGFSPLYTAEDRVEDLKTSRKYGNGHAPMVDNSTYVGIEVEVEGVLNNSSIEMLEVDEDGNTRFLWRNVEDGSLRNNGREFVSLPVKGDNIPFALDVLSKHLKTNTHCKGHEFSDRTSVHIHMNALDLTIEQTMNVMLTYIIVEPLLYKFCGGSRHKNIFCVPLNQTSLAGYIQEVISHGLTGRSDYFACINSWKKYTGFNMRPLRTQGTIEFRHMVGTMDVDKLLLWINLILKIRMFAQRKSFNELKEFILNLNTTSEYMMFINDVFGELSEHVLIDRLDKKMEEMVIFVKDCLSNVDIVKEFNKEVSFSFSKFCKTPIYEKAKALKLIEERIKPKSQDGSVFFTEYVQRVRERQAEQMNRREFVLPLEVQTEVVPAEVEEVDF